MKNDGAHMMRRLLIYVLLFAGSLLFAWPFIWMVGTSIKLDREVLSNRSSVLPEQPIPRSKSPYLDDRNVRSCRRTTSR